MRVLVVAPHPDDEVLGCGGTMARHAEAGDEVHVVVVTRGHPELFPPEFIEQSRREMQRAHAILGVSEARFLDFPAPMMDTIPRHRVADALARAFRELRVETLYVPHHGDMHFEHGLTYEASLVAARPRSGSLVRRILTYETPSETEWSPPIPGYEFQPTVYVDIAATLDKKLLAMACFETQLQAPPHPRCLAHLESLARVRGAAAGLSAAEAFMLVREIQN